MSKGKVARVCLSLGMQSVYLLGTALGTKWMLNKYRAVILKCNDYDSILAHLKDKNIMYKSHVDAGFTCVPGGSNCGCVFFIDESNIIIDNLKLY